MYLVFQQGKEYLIERRLATAAEAKAAFIEGIRCPVDDVIKNPSFDEDDTFDPDAKGYEVFTREMFAEYGEEGVDFFLGL